VAKAAPSEVEAPAKVDVLIEHEEALVEAAECLEIAPAHEHGRARAEQHVFLLHAERAGGLADERLVALAEPREPRVDEVDELAVPVEHAAGYGADGGVALEGG